MKLFARNHDEHYEIALRFAQTGREDHKKLIEPMEMGTSGTALVDAVDDAIRHAKSRPISDIQKTVSRCRKLCLVVNLEARDNDSYDEHGVILYPEPEQRSQARQACKLISKVAESQHTGTG